MLLGCVMGGEENIPHCTLRLWDRSSVDGGWLFLLRRTLKVPVREAPAIPNCDERYSVLTKPYSRYGRYCGPGKGPE